VPTSANSLTIQNTLTMVSSATAQLTTVSIMNNLDITQSATLTGTRAIIENISCTNRITANNIVAVTSAHSTFTATAAVITALSADSFFGQNISVGTVSSTSADIQTLRSTSITATYVGAAMVVGGSVTAIGRLTSPYASITNLHCSTITFNAAQRFPPTLTFLSAGSVGFTSTSESLTMFPLLSTTTIRSSFTVNYVTNNRNLSQVTHTVGFYVNNVEDTNQRITYAVNPNDRSVQTLQFYGGSMAEYAVRIVPTIAEDNTLESLRMTVLG
jgi:hypothetical protein